MKAECRRLIPRKVTENPELLVIMTVDKLGC